MTRERLLRRKPERPSGTARICVTVFLCALLLMISGCEGEHPIRRYLQTVGIEDPDEYIEEREAGELEQWVEKKTRDGTIPGLWSPQGSEKSGETAEPEDMISQEPVDEGEVNSDIDDLIDKLRKETGLADAYGRMEHTEIEESEVTYSDASAQRAKETIGLTTIGTLTVEESQRGLYAFEHLNKDGKKLYAEILTILQNHAEDIVVSTLDENTLDTVFNFVMADHPEIFYTEGYTYSRYTKNGKLYKLSFGGNYTCDSEEQIRRQGMIDAYEKKCFETLKEDADEYETARHIYEYVINNTEYRENAADSQNICSVFINGRSVCQGYAKATQYLLNRRRIEATLVTGKVRGTGHAWVLALIDGEYTYIDPTWGDASYLQVSGEDGFNEKLPVINYTYLCATTQEISRTHTISDELPMPACTDMSNNYYVREDEYFISADLDAVHELFERRYGDGSNNVTLKCSTGAVYEELVDKLITHQAVVGFLHGVNDSFSYTVFKDQYVIIIWLQ